MIRGALGSEFRSLCDIKVISDQESLIIVALTPSFLPPMKTSTVVALAPRNEHQGGQAMYFFIIIGVPGGDLS